jgi:ABC-2 type transport system permease protein
MIRQWLTLWLKESMEMWRNFKWIWIPIVFIVLGLTDPLTMYFMPQILASVGGLPDGAVIEFPTPSGAEVFTMTINQLNTLGILVLVLASMGVVAGERKSGVAGMILVKPVPVASYLTAKWAALQLLGWFSVFLGLFAGWYYTNALFDPVSFSVLLRSFLFYSYWLSFVLTLTVFFSALVRLPGLAGFLTLFMTLLLSFTTGLFERWMSWSPALLVDSALSVVLTNTPLAHTRLSFVMSTLIMILLLLFAVRLFRSKPLA